MEYYPQRPLARYESKYDKKAAEFEPLQWMAVLVSHIPDRGSQAIRYLGHYSNAAGGRLKKEDSQPEYHIIEDDSPTGLNRPWHG